MVFLDGLGSKFNMCSVGFRLFLGSDFSKFDVLFWFLGDFSNGTLEVNSSSQNHLIRNLG